MRFLNICCFFFFAIVSPMFVSCNPEKPEEKFQLYMQILDFFKGLCCVNTEVKEVGQSRDKGTSTCLPYDPERALEGSPSWTSPGSRHKGPLAGAVLAFSPACSMEGRCQPNAVCAMEDIRETEEKDKGMPSGQTLK